jgi:sterol desaturase/sphingolipid hydroxylase (fatty acid hydroxylase superfamily)
MSQWITQHTSLLILAIFLGFAALEAMKGLFKSRNASKEDAPLEAVITLLFAAVIYPGILILVTYAAKQFTPGMAGILSEWPLWSMFVLLLIGDDLTQYWWHRISHTSVLWPLHRAHHSAPHMGIRVVYRNNAFYYAMMPGLWISSYLVFLGCAPVYPWYLILKMLVIFGAHSELRWDTFLYRYRWLNPIAWIVERTISTPATHFAHHAITQDDGIGHYRGNYGNFLFFWDVLFGTALITRHYPPRVGLIDDVEYGQERWWIQLLYPLFKSRRAQSALSKGPVIIQ